MVIYLHEALDKRLGKGELTREDILEATREGSVLRLRPKLMTVAAATLSLVPIFWSTGTGSEVMRPIATPIVGGMVTSTIHVLLVTPVIFLLMKERARKKGKLRASGMKAHHAVPTGERFDGEVTPAENAFAGADGTGAAGREV